MRGRKQLLHAIAVLALVFGWAGLALAQSWSQDGPAPRYHTSAVYDAATDQMIIFGGLQNGTLGSLNDVWSEQQVAVDGESAHVSSNWVQFFATGTAPAARFGHAAVYDSTSNRMIVFGGATTSTSCLQDVWALDDANSTIGTPTWLSLSASGTPPAARMNHTAVYDPTTNTLIVFGGTDCAGNYLSDVWVLSDANGEGGTPTWNQLSPSGTPPAARENASAVYDSVNNVMTIYAGDAGGTGFADVWTLSNANGQQGTPQWTQLSPTGTLAHYRTGQSAVYDSVNDRMIVFGGVNQINGTYFLNDTWVLSYANGLGGTPAWIPITVSGTAPLRHFHSAVYSSATNNMIVFGGESQISQSPADDHIFVLSGANGLK